MTMTVFFHRHFVDFLSVVRAVLPFRFGMGGDKALGH